jgi:hypothetical protein
MGKSRSILSARSEVMPLMDAGLVDLLGYCTDEVFPPRTARVELAIRLVSLARHPAPGLFDKRSISLFVACW